MTTPLWTVAEDAEAYARAGFRSIGIWLQKLEQTRIENGFVFPSKRIPEGIVAEAAAAVASTGLRVSHVVLAGGFGRPERRDAAVDHAVHATDVAGAFGADCLVVNPGPLQGFPEDESFRLSVDALREILARRRAPVRLALEPTVAWQSDSMTTLARALDIAEAVDHPDLGVYPDPFHLWDTETYYEDVARAGDRIFGFHLADGHPGERERAIPGEGKLPLVEMVRAAEAAGYRGTYDVEYTTPMALGAAFDVPYEEVIERCAIGATTILAAAGVDPARQL